MTLVTGKIAPIRGDGLGRAGRRSCTSNGPREMPGQRADTRGRNLVSLVDDG